MKPLLLRMIREDDGVLSFEWVIMITVIVIGLVVGLCSARDGVVDELGDAAEAMVSLDQSYYVDHPLLKRIIDPRFPSMATLQGASDSGFEDVAEATDCTRNGTVAEGQGALNDGN